MDNVDWQRDNASLLLAVSAGCHFCSEDAPFYQRLTTDLAGSKVGMMAVVPESDAEGRDYLKSLGVSITDVRHVSLNSLGISGIPTILIVDNTGTVKKVWVGKLSSADESEVLNVLDSYRSPSG